MKRKLKVPLTVVLAAGLAAMAGLRPDAAGEDRPGSGPSPAATGAAAGRRLPPAELDALLTRLEKRLGDLNTLHTGFVQEKHLSIFSDVVLAEGYCLFRRPDMVRIEMTRPFRSVMLARGQSTARFELVEGKWTRIQVAFPEAMLMVTGQIASWLQGRFRDAGGIYDLSAVQADRTWLVLTPRPEQFRKRISAIEIALDADQTRIRQIAIRESGGDFTLLTFRDERIDVPLGAEVFDTDGEQPSPLPAPPTSAPASRPARQDAGR